MKKEMSEALIEFYHQILQPEFSRIHAKLAEHDENFREIDGHFKCIIDKLDCILMVSADSRSDRQWLFAGDDE